MTPKRLHQIREWLRCNDTPGVGAWAREAIENVRDLLAHADSLEKRLDAMYGLCDGMPEDVIAQIRRDPEEALRSAKRLMQARKDFLNDRRMADMGPEFPKGTL